MEFQSILKNTVTIEAFLLGCSEKRAALATLDKDPQTFDEAECDMESAITNLKLIIGANRQIKRVTFDMSSESAVEEPSVRVAMTTSKPSDAIETRISTLEE